MTTRNVVRVLVVGILVALSVTGTMIASEELKNTDSETAVALHIQFSRAVRIVSHGREFKTQEPSGRATVFMFSNGNVRPRRTFELEWSPSSARILSIEWLSETDLIPPEPTLVIVPSATYGEAPFLTSFEAVLENADSAGTRFEWDFGDGSSAAGQSVNHSYGVMGVYQVALTAYPSGDDAVVASALITVSPLYVNPKRGDDSLADGTIERPFRTITTAVTHAATGQALLLAPGVYNAASGEDASVELPGTIHIVGSGGSPDDVKVIGDIYSRYNTVISNIHAFGQLGFTFRKENPEHSARPTVLGSWFTDTAGQKEGIVLNDYVPSRVLFIKDCTFIGHHQAILIWRGEIAVEDCEFSEVDYGIAATAKANVTVVSSFIHDSSTAIWVVHGGRAVIRECQLINNSTAVLISGESRGEVTIEACTMSSNYYGVSLDSSAIVDLGGGPFGSAGSNTFAGNEKYNIKDSRPPYSGDLYAMGNDWGSIAVEKLEGPAIYYNQEKCYIENEGNSIIFSD